MVGSSFHRTLFAFLTFSLALASEWPATAQTSVRRLAVLEFQGKKVDAETLTTFSDAVRSGALEALARTGIDVMTRENMLTLMKDMGKGECNEGECEVETARNIGADFVVSGIVVNIEDRYVVTLKLHETKGGSLLGSEMAKAKTQLEILDALHEQSRELIRAHLGRERSSAHAREGHIAADGDFVAKDDRILVTFESDPLGATVLLDGDVLCKETPCSRSVIAGRHDVEMQKERYDRAQQRIDAKKGVVVHLNLPANFAVLVVKTEPGGLSISLDGKPQGNHAPVLEVDPGAHEVVIDHPCFQRSGEQLVLKKNERREIKLTGSPRQSAIAVTAENERGDEVEAKVFIDGVEVGTTPGTFTTGVCSKEVLVDFGRDQFRSSLKLVEKEVANIRAKLRTDSTFPAMAGTSSADLSRPLAPQQGATSGWQTAGLITAGVGAFGVGIGVYFGLKARSISNDLASRETFSSAKDDDRKTAITLQYVGYAVGGVAIASGLTMYLFGRHNSNVALVPQVSPRYAGVALQARLQ
jgi:TolB-like protein